MTRLVDLRLVIDRDGRLVVRVDGQRREPHGSLAAALAEVARACGLDVPAAEPDAVRAAVEEAIG